MGGTFAERRRVAASASELVLAYRCRNSFDGCQHLDSAFWTLRNHPETSTQKEASIQQDRRIFRRWPLLALWLH